MTTESQIKIIDLHAWYGMEHALKGVTADIPARQITAIIGPSGCGKTTLLRTLNRLLEETDGTRVEGKVLLNGIDIYGRGVDVTDVRTRVGMLAPKPFPLPMSIYDNVAYGRRIHGLQRGLDKGNGRNLDRIVEKYLRAAGLWDEVKDRLQAPATGLSTGQQQRLCLARALAVEPEVLLCDEATSALDPISAQGIEEQLCNIKVETTIVMVTHALRQARRLADHVIFLWMGELVETGSAVEFFDAPRDERSQAYLAGDIG
ncbi:MAG: phosphate ABC transporter ATP-binding protein [Anaerolineae bacterium]|jgi:phosphate transport system ATP-binding protein|nr:phosphate ABC transporter ATP-binding protein [Anaerolineae bacterium]MDX9830940.1 phosphate ABC transporter ATP-binding protein [Anaerolineae bacterium]